MTRRSQKNTALLKSQPDPAGSRA